VIRSSSTCGRLASSAPPPPWKPYMPWCPAYSRRLSTAAFSVATRRRAS
jgi:hypothetical protein